METTLKMQAKKEKLSRLFKCAWQFCKTEGLSLSKALRKAWLLFTSLKDHYRFSPSMFDHASIEIVCKSEYVGCISILEGGFVNAKNRLNCSKIFLNRHDAITFALSAQKNKAIAQLPLI